MINKKSHFNKKMYDQVNEDAPSWDQQEHHTWTTPASEDLESNNHITQNQQIEMFNEIGSKPAEESLVTPFSAADFIVDYKEDYNAAPQ